MKKCVFFDRDGIVNESPGEGKYILKWEDFKILPSFIESLKVVLNKGYDAAIVTNQRCVALGLITEDKLQKFHNKLQNLLVKDYGMKLLDIAYCPHEEGMCTCRKPLPGMILELARKHDINLELSWTIGDDERDIIAGRAAGTKTIFVGIKKLTKVQADYFIASIVELPDLLEKVL